MAVLRLTVLIAALSLSGCQPYTLAQTGRPILVADNFTVTPDINWSRSAVGNAEIWTVDGPLLENLTFLTNVGKGDPLAPTSFWMRLEASQQKEGKMPTFDPAMNTLEVADLVRETYIRNGQQNFSYTNLTPQTFGGNTGFHFDFTFTTAEGLDKQGMAVGALVDEKLHIAIYTGAAEYYFEKYKSAVDNLLNSLQINQG
jgi:hypothetical protein